MQNPIKKIRQSSFVFEKPSILPENFKLSRAPTALQFSIFCWNFAHVSYLPMSTKACVGFFKFCLDRDLFAKIKKTWFLHTLLCIFINDSRSKQNKKVPEHPFVDIGK